MNTQNVIKREEPIKAAFENAKYLPEGILIRREENKRFTQSVEALEDCRVSERIVEAVCVKCDPSHNLIVDFGFMKGIIPRNEGAAGIDTGVVRDIALIKTVTKPVCFKVMEFADGVAVLSRKQAQLECIENYLEQLKIGDIIPAKVTRLEKFRCFADIGCGIISMINIADMSISGVSHSCHRFYIGQEIIAAIKTKDGWVEDISATLPKIALTHKELLGTWEQNVSRFSARETVMGIARLITEYGIFIELAPNLIGLAELWGNEKIRINQTVSVFIKAIIPEKSRIRLTVIDTFDFSPTNYDYEYYINSGRIDSWIYTENTTGKVRHTEFTG